jgi:hypothetical protein
MTRLQNDLVRAGKSLGLRIITPYEVTLPSGRNVVADALIPEIGSPKGMLIVQSYDAIEDITDEIVNCGYGYSVLDEPGADETFDLEAYVDMFADWGWDGRPEGNQ